MLRPRRSRLASPDSGQPPAQRVLLEAHGLTRTFAGQVETPVAALRGIDLTIQPGEFVAVMGPSGCGKSTLLHLLGGLDRPSSGEVYLRGQRVDRLSEAQWARLRRTDIGVVFQFFNLIANLSVADNVELPALLAGRSPAEARTRREELLARLGLDERAGLVPGRLSGGQQQRVAIARALINQPALLLADEPTGNLDSAAAREVMTLLQEVHAAGQAMLLVTHDARVASLADRMITMRDGLIVDDTSLSVRSASQSVRSSAPLGRFILEHGAADRSDDGREAAAADGAQLLQGQERSGGRGPGRAVLA